MKQSDWQNAFGPAPESFRECVDQTLNRLEDKEMRKRTKFTTALVAAALITALLAGAAIAAGNLGIWRYLYTGSPIIPLEGADEMVAIDVASAQNEYFRISVEEAVYDGFGAILKLKAAPVNPEKYVLLNSHTIAADLANPEDYILEPNPELGGEGWSNVVGVKDGRQIICVSSPIVTVDGIDTAETLDLFNSRWEENNEDGSIDYWISSSFHENLPEKLPVRITVKGYDPDMNNIYGALDDLTFTLQKTHQERKVKLIPIAPIAENNIEIHDLGITFTDVRGYFCAEYTEKALSPDSMGLSFRLYTADGEEINTGAGEAWELDNGHIREQQEMQSLSEIPETLILEVFEIAEASLGKVECRVEAVG